MSNTANGFGPKKVFIFFISKVMYMFTKKTTVSVRTCLRWNIRLNILCEENKLDFKYYILFLHNFQFSCTLIMPKKKKKTPYITKLRKKKKFYCLKGFEMIVFSDISNWSTNCSDGGRRVWSNHAAGCFWTHPSHTDGPGCRWGCGFHQFQRETTMCVCLFQ